MSGTLSSAEMLVERNVGVPMRDGVVLRADVSPDDNGRCPRL